jgi:hypothetical protein
LTPPVVCCLFTTHEPAGSICSMKRNTHVFIPEGQFRLLSGADNLACYQVSLRHPHWHAPDRVSAAAGGQLPAAAAAGSGSERAAGGLWGQSSSRQDKRGPPHPSKGPASEHAPARTAASAKLLGTRTNAAGVSVTACSLRPRRRSTCSASELVSGVATLMASRLLSHPPLRSCCATGAACQSLQPHSVLRRCCCCCCCCACAQLYCRTCGICSHYRPRSNPDCVAVTIYCIDPSTPLTVVAVRNFHGQQWERSFAASDLPQAGLAAAAAFQ